MGIWIKKNNNALNVIKPPFNVGHLAQLAATESLKDKKFIERSIKHNLYYAKKIKSYLENIIFFLMQFLQISYF
jgi:histidinol-phosphate aminotransferase